MGGRWGRRGWPIGEGGGGEVEASGHGRTAGGRIIGRPLSKTRSFYTFLTFCDGKEPESRKRY
jgi:hypothetical protein